MIELGVTENGKNLMQRECVAPLIEQKIVKKLGGILTVDEESEISADYVDVADGTDTSASVVLVDPLGIVFDSSRGLPVDGATITLINTNTGLPAVVFGDDGVSSFPATITSGGTATRHEEGAADRSAASEPDRDLRFDPAALRRLAELGRDSSFVSRLVDKYLSSSAELLAALRDAVTSSDPEALGVAAHTLKSSSAQIGAVRLSALCKELEALGRSGSMQGAAALCDEVAGELESTCERLAAEGFGARDA